MVGSSAFFIYICRQFDGSGGWELGHRSTYQPNPRTGFTVKGRQGDLIKYNLTLILTIKLSQMKDFGHNR